MVGHDNHEGVIHIVMIGDDDHDGDDDLIVMRGSCSLLHIMPHRHVLPDHVGLSFGFNNESCSTVFQWVPLCSSLSFPYFDPQGIWIEPIAV